MNDKPNLYLVILTESSYSPIVLPVAIFATPKEAKAYAKKLKARLADWYVDVEAVPQTPLPMEKPGFMFYVSIMRNDDGSWSGRYVIPWDRYHSYSNERLQRYDEMLSDEWDGRIVDQSPYRVDYHVLAANEEAARSRALALFRGAHPDATIAEGEVEE